MKLVIIGSGLHARQILDVAEICGFNFIGFIDDFNKDQTMGGIEIIPNILKETVDLKFIIGVGESYYRRQILKKLNIPLCNIIHPNAIISHNTKLGVGNFISAGVILNNSVKIGNNNIINTSSIIEHNVTIGDFCNINPNVTICGSSQISDNVSIGASATIIEKLNIGKNSIIGANSLVLSDTESYTLNYGNPSKKIRIIKDNQKIFK